MKHQRKKNARDGRYPAAARVTLAWLVLGLASVSGCKLTGDKQDYLDTSVDPPDASVHLSLAQAYERLGDSDAAIHEYQQAIQADSKQWLAHWRTGVLLDQIGHFADARQFYEQAAVLDPNNPELLCDMGYNAYLSRDWTEAEQMFQRVLAIDSQHPRAQNNLAMVFAGQGRYAEAFDMFRSVNGDAAAHCNLAFAFAAQGDFEASRRAYQTALNLQPSLPAAKAGLVRMADVQSRLVPTQIR